MFDYQSAFSRNIGWITEKEQEVLRSKRIAIAGAGGVGGEHLITLTRLGIESFKISDFDVFEIHNMNRQAGAFVSTLNREKVKVMKEMALDINPQTEIEIFDQGTTAENVKEFLQGVDLYVDSLDFFALSARKLLFEQCYLREIPAITAAPLGMGSALLCFTPDSMSFNNYFCFDEAEPETEQLLKFLVGLAPGHLHASYLVDKSKADFKEKKGPSTPMAVKMCASVAGSAAIKLLLGRGKVIKAPRGIQYDGYRNQIKTTWRPWGNRNPIQALSLHLARKIVLGDAER